MALMRAQARHLLFRLQGVCASADAALTGAPCIASRTCTTLAAADGHTVISANFFSAHRSSDPCDSVLLQQPVRSAAAPPAAADSLLWTSFGIHSLRPAVVGALSQPPATGTAPPSPVEQQLQQHSDWLDDGEGMSAASEGQPPAPAMSLVKRTYQPSVIVRKRRHGFLSRLRSKGGQRVLERRRLKGRWKKSA